MPGVFRII